MVSTKHSTNPAEGFIACRCINCAKMKGPSELGRTISPNKTEGKVDAYTSLRDKLTDEVLQRFLDTDSDDYYFTLP